ncbi:MAG TPA: ABC transporter permease [Polyangia bacterium]|nr:ABC transporter permease [Polyangia bacterium]
MPTRSLWAFSAVRLKLFFREPGSLFWTFGFPLLVTVALGVAFRNQGPARTPVAIVAGPGADGVRAALAARPGLSPRVVDAAEATRELRTGEVMLAIEAPAAGAAAPLVFRYDPSRPEAHAARRLADDVLQAHAGRRDVVATRDETAVARGGRYVDWLVPGLLGLQLLNGAMWGAAFNIVNARQRKLLKRLAATPMRRGHYLLSYRVSGLVFVPLQLFVLFAFARLTFGVVIQGSLLAVLGLALLGSWAFAGLGLLCAARAENSETANGLINLVTLPMMVFSGVFFSSSRFPAVLQPVIRLLPLSAFNEALRHVVNDGASIFTQGFPIAVLAAWTVVTSVLAVRLFRWT